MKSLEKFASFVNEIMKENGRNYKLSVLEKYKEDEDIKYYLNYIYNPYITTGIGKQKLEVSYGNLLCDVVYLDPNGDRFIPCWDLRSRNYSESVLLRNPIEIAPAKMPIQEACDFIATYNTGSETILQLIQLVRDRLYGGHEDLIPLFDKILTKDLQLGINISSINKVIPNLIPEFKVQLANKYFDEPEIVEDQEFALTTKIDGGRIIAIKKNGVARFYTRQGQEYEGLNDLVDEMEKYIPDNTCLDGEITLLDKGNLTSKEQYKQTMKITRADGEKHGIKMLVFDYMSAEDFERQSCDKTYDERRAELEKIMNYNNKYFEILPVLYKGKDTSKITELLSQAIENKEEGLMINITNAKYDFKRTNSLLKVKKMKDIDLPIIGYEEGTNSNKNKLGAFIVDYKGNNLKVGSGFSKELREEIWKHPDDYIGITISIQYFEETENAEGIKSLRFPVFMDFRYDK